MKLQALPAVFLALCLGNVWAEGPAPVAVPVDAAEPEVEIAPSDEGSGRIPVKDIGDFCFFSDAPPANTKYTVIRKLKLGKGSYGGVKDILPRFVERARKAGADAIINYTGSQRFGFWPWRVVRPVVRGTAIKWADSSNEDCRAMGGSTLKMILSTNQPPA
jgi:hypothetical protein